MRSPFVIVGDRGSHPTAQMLLVEHHHMGERVSPDTADDPLAIGILPRRSRGDFDFFNIHVLDALAHMLTVNAIAVPQQIAGGR